MEKRLLKTTFYHRDFRPITDIDFNLILIESFGNNPLDADSLEKGLKKQNEALDKIVEIIKQSNPQTLIAFVATIAPNKENYALGQVNLTKEKRVEWVDVRIKFIKNHIEYARSHNIPIIDIFDDSVDRNGNGNLEYISTRDYIHPSPKGIIFISKKIADDIYKYQLLKSH